MTGRRGGYRKKETGMVEDRSIKIRIDRQSQREDKVEDKMENNLRYASFHLEYSFRDECLHDIDMKPECLFVRSMTFVIELV